MFLQVVCPAHPSVCSTLRIAQCSMFSCGACGVVWWDGILVSGARVVDEVSEGGEVIGIEGSHSLGEKAVEQSGRAGSDAPVPSS